MGPTAELEGVLTHIHKSSLDLLKSVSREQLAWRPAPSANSAGFLLWHLARNEDLWLHRFISRGPQVHETGGWDKRFNLNIPKGESLWITAGAGWNDQQVASFPAYEPALLLGYFEAVRADTLAYLRGLPPEDLESKPRPDRSPNTVGWVLRQMAMHEAHHVGQIDYIRGLAPHGQK